MPVGMPPGHSFWNDWYEKIRQIVNNIQSTFTWANIVNKPTTILGFGITDAYTKTEVDNKFVLENWNSPTYTNSWIDYGGTFAPGAYYKDSFGVVHLRGLIKNGSTGLAAFTLPLGYRPSSEELFTSVTNLGVGSINITTSGQVIPSSLGNGYVTLSGISFRT